MKLKDFKKLLDYNDALDGNLDVVIKVDKPGVCLGPTPCEDVKFAYVGFDFDAGRLIIEPDSDLTTWSCVESFIPGAHDYIIDKSHGIRDDKFSPNDEKDAPFKGGRHDGGDWI